MPPDTATTTTTSLSICTFNVGTCGLFKLKQHGLPGGTLAQVLNLLESDIVCLQETKLAAASCWPGAFQRIAQVPGWDSFVCFTRKGGYSGVATYCRQAAASVRAAEEGLLRVLPRQNPVAAAAQHVASNKAAAAAAAVGEGARNQAVWPAEIVFPEAELRSMFTAEEALAVDKDGRCMITDHGLFVLFNLYAPACTGKNGLEQRQMKGNMCRALDVRMRALLAAGRHVMLAGDFNVGLPLHRDRCVISAAMFNSLLKAVTDATAAAAAAPVAQDQAEQGGHASEQQQQQPPQQQSPQQQSPLPPAAQQLASQVLQAGLGVSAAELDDGSPPADLLLLQQQQQVQPVVVSEDNYAPHATYRLDKPALPESGMAEWLIQLTAPDSDDEETCNPSDPNSSSSSGGLRSLVELIFMRQWMQQQLSGASPTEAEVQAAAAALLAATGSKERSLPTAGVLIDTLSRTNLGVNTFLFPDTKKGPGHFKERMPYTCWDFHFGRRNDQHGGRGDFILIADAAEYAAKLAKLQQQQQQQQQPGGSQPPQPSSVQGLAQQACSISLAAALTHSSSYILRELRWADHAPVVLKLQLPPEAAELLHSPPSNAAMQSLSSSQMQQLLQRPQEPSYSPMAVQAAGCRVQAAPRLRGDLAAAPAGSGSDNNPDAAVKDDDPTAAAAAAAAGVIEAAVMQKLPCPLSTHWLVYTLHAKAVAAAMLRAAGIQRPTADLLTCSILTKLQTKQYAAATDDIKRRCDELYLPSAPGPEGAAAAAAAASGAGQDADVDMCAAEQQQQQKASALPAAAAAAQASPATAAAASGSLKRKGRRGWRVVSIGNGRTASVACSSSDDSDG